MYIYTHRRWNKKSPIYDGNLKRLLRPLTKKQQGTFINDGIDPDIGSGRAKLFLRFRSEDWYKATNLFYGPHTWILKYPQNDLEHIGEEIINFAEDYYEKTYEMLKKAESEMDKYPKDEYTHPKAKKSEYETDIYNKEKISYYMYGQTGHSMSPSEFIDISRDRHYLVPYINPYDIEDDSGVWEDEYFVDAVRNEFGVSGFRVESGAVVIMPKYVKMEYYYDYDKKELNDREKYVYRSGKNIQDKYDTIIFKPDYQNRKIEDQNLLNILKKIDTTEDDDYEEENDYI